MADFDATGMFDDLKEEPKSGFDAAGMFDDLKPANDYPITDEDVEAYEDLNTDEDFENQANLNIREAAGTDPLKEAEINRLAKKNGVTPSIASNDFQSYSEQDKADKTRAAVNAAPALKKYFALNPTNAKIAGKDIDVLATSERELKEWFTDPLATLASGGNSLMKTVLFLANTVNRVSELTGGGLGSKVLGIDETMLYKNAQEGLSEQRQQIEEFKSLKLQAQNKIVGYAEGVGGALGALYSNPLATADIAGQQLVQMAPVAKLTSLVSGAKAMVATNMAASGVMGGADAGVQAEDSVRNMSPEYLKENSKLFNDLLESGVDEERAQEMVAQQSGLVGASIAAPISAVINSIGAGVETKFINQILGKAATDLTIRGAYKAFIPTFAKEATENALDEAFTTGSSNVGVKLTADKTQDIAQGVPESFALGGALGGGFGIAPASSTVILSHLNNQLKAANAEAEKAKIERINKLAEATEMISHSPEEYQEIIKSQAEGGAENVYLDPKVFQSEKLAAEASILSQSIKEQLPSAIETGSLIKIPMAEYMAQLASSDISGGIIDHIKVDPNGFTKSEANEWSASESANLEQEMTRIAEEYKTDEVFKQSKKTVEDTIRYDLESTGKFTPSVNSAYSKITSSYYAARAAKLGVTPEELFNEHRLKVVSDSIPDTELKGEALNQLEKSLNDMTAELYTLILPKEKLNDQNSQLPNELAPTKEFDHAANSPTLRRIRSHSDKIYPQLGGIAEAPIRHNGKLGASAGYTTRAEEIEPDSAYPEGRLEVHVFTDEQIKNGLTDSPSLTILMEPNGSFQIDGPAQNSETFKALQEQGAAGVAKGKEGIRQDSWSVLKDPSGKPMAKSQLLELMGDVHARTRVWKDADKVAFNWSRSTGATGVESGGREGSTEYFQSNNLPEAIDINGVSRSTTNSNGQPIHQTEEGVRNFWKWFGDSKVVDDQGRPLVVYHGTKKPFKKVSMKKGAQGIFWFSTSRESIEKGESGAENVSTIMPLYAKIESPADWKQYDRLSLGEFKGRGLDGAMLKEGDFYDGFVMEPNQIKSAIGNTGEFDPADTSIVNQKKMGYYSPKLNTIGLLDNVNRSTFIHELGHFFFETDIRIAAKLAQKENLTDGEKSIINDVSALLDWHGIKGTINEQTDAWQAMTPEERRDAHERTAESFEHYIFTGNAPSAELQSVFRDLARWMTQVYSSIKEFLQLNPEAGKLNPEVTAIFDRMLASQKQIEVMEYSRSMVPLVKNIEDAESLQLSVEEFAELTTSHIDATNEATEELQAKTLKDMQWLRNARGKEIGKLKRESAAIRNSVRDEVRFEVMREPIYQAWSWLTGRIDSESKIKARDKIKKKTGVDVEQDTLLVAIAKLGGVTKESIKDSGLDQEDYSKAVFGKPVVRAKGGKSLDALAETLAEYGYLPVDQHGKPELSDLINKIQDEARGDAQYSNEANYDLIFGEQRIVNPEALNAARLNYGAVNDISEVAESLKARGMTANDGIHPDIAASVLNFDSGETLVNQLAEVEPPNDKIERLTDERMLKEHGEVATPQSLELAADKAAHNTLRAKTLAREHNALAKATGSSRLLFPAVVEYANKMLSAMKIKDINPNEFTSAEAKAGKLAEKYFRESSDKVNTQLENKLKKLKKDKDAAAIAVNNLQAEFNTPEDIEKANTELSKAEEAVSKAEKELPSLKTKAKAASIGHLKNAAKEKRNQVIHNLTAKTAYDVKDEVKKSVLYIKKLRKSKQLRGQSIIQIADLANRFGFTSVENKKEKDKLGEWITEESVRLSAAEPSIPGFILDETVSKIYNELTVDEFRDLVDAFKQLELLGKRENKQYKEIRNQSFDEEKKALLDAIKSKFNDSFDAEGKPIPYEKSPSVTFSQGVGRAARELYKKAGSAGEDINGVMLSPENLAKLLAGGEFGAVWESLFSRMSKASDHRAELMKELFKEMKPVFSDYSLAERIAFGQAPLYIKEIDKSMTKEKILMVALHYGHKEGRDRLKNHGWSDAQIEAIISKLNEKDVALLEKIWDVFDNKLWPQLKDLNERTLGVAPKKAEAVPYVINGKTVTGGYMMLDYEPSDDAKVQAINDAEEYRPLIAGGRGMSAKTKQTTSQERKNNVKLKLKLDFGVFTKAVNETVHDLAFREAAADTMRVLSDKDVQNAVKQSIGTAGYNALVHNVKMSAAPVREEEGFMLKALSFARRRTIAVLMTGFNTAIQNILGFTATASKFTKNPVALTKAMAGFVKNPVKEAKFCLENSAYMRGRLDNFDASLNDFAKHLSVKGDLLPGQQYFFILMATMDRIVTIPSWNAAYKDGMDKFDNDHDKSVDYADGIVRQTQGSGREVDLPKVMNGVGNWGKAAKIFTMFYSWFNSQYGLLATEGAIAKRAFKNGDAKEKALALGKFTAQFQLIVTANVVLTEILMRGLPDDDDDEDRWAKAFASFGFGMFPLVRDIAGAYMAEYAPSAKYNASFKFSPIEAVMTSAVKAPGAISDIWEGEGTEADEKTAIMGTSAMLGLPGKFIYDSKKTIDGWLEGQAWPAAVGPKK